MNGLIFICLLFLCGVSGFREVSEASASVNAAADRFTYEFQHNPLSTINKYTAGAYAFWKTYFYEPIAHGNFYENTIRGYKMLETDVGKSIFGSLDGELNQSFRSLMEDGNPRTGDIISCRIPNSRMAEHYMMVLNKKILEVAVVGGKDTHNGVIMIDSYRKSSYINSTECLHHRNRFISTAEQFDEQDGDDKETERMYQEILDRVNCTISGRNSGHFYYDLVTCNCQDFVLYWTYGYNEISCLESLFNGCAGLLRYELVQISAYVNKKRRYHLKKRRENIVMLPITNLANISIG